MHKLAVLALLACACTDNRDSDIVGTQSLRLTLLTPADPGNPDNRLADADRNLAFDIEALDETGQRDTSFAADLQVYAQFLGTLTPTFGEQPLATFSIAGGVKTGQTISLPPVFGPTVLWIDNGSGVGPDYVHGTITGTSPTLWFRDPHIADLQTPRDEMGLDALTATPLQDKQISVGGKPGSASALSASRFGANGRLVVTAVFAQGYTVSDVLCSNAAGDPPCALGPHDAPSTLPDGAYDHALVFTFSAPRGDNGPLQAGDVITGFAGGMSEFLGLTEIGFPQTFGGSDNNPARIPAPQVVQPSWFNSLSDPDGEINFERNEAGLIEVDNATVCDLDDDFVEHKQWKLDPAGVGGDCMGKDNVINVVTTGITGIDPAALVGQKLTKVIGSLRPLNFGGSGNVWLIFPRGTDDLTLP